MAKNQIFYPPTIHSVQIRPKNLSRFIIGPIDRKHLLWNTSSIWARTLAVWQRTAFSSFGGGDFMEQIQPRIRNGLVGFSQGNLGDCGKNPAKALGGICHRLGSVFFRSGSCSPIPRA
jgi:hypothetical protein